MLIAEVAIGQTPSAPWIATSEPITILSANDGWTHARLTGDPALTRDTENLTADSITVVHLGPGHPPVTKTVYGTVPNSIFSAPYSAMTGDGRYGFVPSMGRFTFGDRGGREGTSLISVIDLVSAETCRSCRNLRFRCLATCWTCIQTEGTSSSILRLASGYMP